jgi:hypothetical protein
MYRHLPLSNTAIPPYQITETQLGKSRWKISGEEAAEQIFWKETAEQIFWRFRAKIVEELLISLFYFYNYFVVLFLKFWDSP